MTCRRCKLNHACKNFKGVCPWVYYLILFVVILAPGVLFWNAGVG